MTDDIKIEDDLIIGKETEDSEPLADAVDCEIYIPTEYELVIAACNALDTAESMDPLTDVGRKRKRRIMRKSMEILDYAINNMHIMCFDEKKDDEDNQES